MHSVYGGTVLERQVLLANLLAPNGTTCNYRAKSVYWAPSLALPEP
jgi:hypothetical protein